MTTKIFYCATCKRNIVIDIIYNNETIFYFYSKDSISVPVSNFKEKGKEFIFCPLCDNLTLCQ
jgi:hypothetical protein